jgi:hypothetical protein
MSKLRASLRITTTAGGRARTMTTDRLSPEHRRTLEQESGIAPEAIDARGYRTITAKVELRDVGFSNPQRRVPALLLPVWGVQGEIVLYQARPDAPRIRDGKPVKYETPAGTRMVLDVHPLALPKIGDPSVPLFITEGIKKADALISRGCCSVALLGVWNWRGTNSKGGKATLADWESIALNGRQGYVVFDSDVMLKPQVHQALVRLKGFLESRGAVVALIYLPSGDGGQKVGADDYLSGGHTIDDLLALARVDVEEPRRDEALPTIMVSGRPMRDISTDAWGVLTKINLPPFLFQRGHLLVDIIRDDHRNPVLRTMDKVALKGVLDRIADFVRETKEGILPARPPSDVVADMMAAKDLPLPLLLGLVQAPIFTSHGVLDMTPGYQPETCCYLHLKDGSSIPPVPVMPDSTTISRARTILLDELLGDFPFVSDADRAHAVSALVLPFVRLMIDGPTPLHLFESPTPGSGKGLLVEAITIPASGRGPAVMTEGRDEEEWRKRITAKLLQSPQVVLIDNVRSRLDSAALSAALTSLTWEDRVLGYSRTATIPVTCTWLATANNPALSLEVARRTLSSRLDAGMEKPWKRTGFRHKHLRRWALQHRSELIWAALTLVQAWIAAGMPLGQETLGGYEACAEVIGGILDVAGIPGFLTNQDRVYAEADQEVNSWAEFCQVWWEEFQDRQVKADLLFGLAMRHKLLLDLWSGRDDHAARTAFGKALSRMRERVIGDFRIRRVGEDTHAKVLTYRLDRLTVKANRQFAGDAGVSGGFSDPENRDGDSEHGEVRARASANTAEEPNENLRLPGTPANPRIPRNDPWDPFLDEARDGVG